MPLIDLIPPVGTHTPPGSDHRAILYPLWVLTIQIRPYPRAAPRVIRFSVDGVRGIPLPIKGAPEVVAQDVPPSYRLLPAVPERDAQETTRHYVKKGLGWLGGWMARIRFTESRKVYKLFWLAEPDGGARHLVDSRSGAEVPIPDEATDV